MAKKAIPVVGFGFAVYGLWQSVQATFKMVGREMPAKDAEQYVAVMLASTFLTTIVGAKTRSMAKKGAENDAAYWKMSPEDQANYNAGQQALPKAVWDRLVGAGLGGQDPASVVARGRDLRANYSAARRLLLGLQGTPEFLRNSATPGRGMTFGQWLDSGLTPELRFVFAENAGTVLAGISAGVQTEADGF